MFWGWFCRVFIVFQSGWGNLTLDGGSTSSLSLPCFPSRALLLDPSAILARDILWHRLRPWADWAKQVVLYLFNCRVYLPSFPARKKGYLGNKVESLTIDYLNAFPHCPCFKPWLWGTYHRSFISTGVQLLKKWSRSELLSPKHTAESSARLHRPWMIKYLQS